MKRRTVKSITRFLTPSEIYNLITSRNMPYRVTPNFYHIRDRGLMGMGVLSAGRINEILGLRKEQFDREESPHYIVVKQMRISKRKKETIEKYGPHVAMRWPFILPLSHNEEVYEYPKLVELVPFSELVVEHLNQIEESERLFNFGTRWAYDIINGITGQFPNWFRAQAEMIYGSIFKDSVKLAKFVGVVRPEQVAHYIGYDYREMLKKPTKMVRK